MIAQALQKTRRRVSQLDRTVVTAVVLLASVFPVELFPNTPPPPSGIDGQYSGKQGQIVVVTVPSEDPMAEVEGTFLNRRIPFFPDPRPGASPGYVGLLGIDLQDEPGTHELAVVLKHGESSRRLSFNVLVVKEKFHVEHLTLPKDKVDLNDKALARWKAEQAQVKSALAADSRLRLWRDGFIEPVNGKKTGIFGSLRIMNGKPRNPHNGEDIGAPTGTPVVASNDGVVRLTVDHFFSGKGIFLDHGLGLYSMYFHLSEVLVKAGDLVKAGQLIGKVGSTGRVTGPHLHWGAKINGARVNPYALLDLPLITPASPIDGVTPVSADSSPSVN